MKSYVELSIRIRVRMQCTKSYSYRNSFILFEFLGSAVFFFVRWTQISCLINGVCTRDDEIMLLLHLTLHPQNIIIFPFFFSLFVCVFSINRPSFVSNWTIPLHFDVIHSFIYQRQTKGKHNIKKTFGNIHHSEQKLKWNEKRKMEKVHSKHTI